MAAVWIVATGENYEGMDTRNMLMFDNEESATQTGELLNELRRKHEQWCEACENGDAEWNDPNMPSASVELLDTKIYLGDWTVVQKFEVHG